MRTAAAWAVIGILGIGVLSFAADDQPAPPPPPPLVAPGGAAPDAAPPAVAPPGAAPVAPKVGPAAAVPAPAKVVLPSDPAVVALIADLGSPDYRTREKAGAALEAKGEKALPDLRRALDSTPNPEVARRLSVLVRKMDHDRLVAPKRVTLAVKDKSAKEVFEEIGRQTGYKFDYQAGGDGKFSFDFTNAPFWVVVDKVAEATNTSVYTDYDDDTIRINGHSDAHNPYVAYAGPFRLVATGINSNKNVQLSGLTRRGFGPRPQEHINLNFQIHSEPKNPILGTHQAEVISATDETGASLVPPKNTDGNSYRSGYYNPGYRGHNAYGNVNLLRGAKDATTIKALKGKVGIMLLAGTRPEVVIDDPVKVKNKKLVGRTVEVDYDSMAAANGQYTVSLTIRKTGTQDPNNIDYNWSNNLWQKLELTDAQGNKYRSYGPNSTNHNGVSVTMTVPFGPDNRRGVPQKLGPPVRFVVNEWLQVTHEVTFEFKDVPLP
jgi:hypothetical protein